MRVLLTALAGLAFISAASAESRYEIGGWSCERVKATIAREGAAILRYRSARNPSLSLYDRYVRDTRFCPPGQVIAYASVPAADTKSCPVRRCKEIEPPDTGR